MIKGYISDGTDLEGYPESWEKKVAEWEDSDAIEKFYFYMQNKYPVTFRLKPRSEYFFTGTIKEIRKPENSVIVELENGDYAIFVQGEIDLNSIHPKNYQPIRYFEREPITPEMRKAVFERDNYECKLKLEGCTGKAEHCDHKIPSSVGGLTTIENLQAACAHCNLKKGNRI